MKINLNIVSAVISFLSNLFGVLVAYRVLAVTSAWITGAGIFATGLCLGILHGWFFGRAYVQRIGFWAFIAMCVLWAPIVLATYGFALLGLPLLAAYALVVIIGALFGAGQPFWNRPNIE